jgi:hypothetical protein
LQKVLLVMYRSFIAQTLAKSMKNDLRFEFFLEHDYKNASSVASTFKPHIAVVEVPENKGRQTQEYIAVCTEIRKASPGCKLMLLCPESSEQSKSVAINAIRTGEINDFVFFDSSWEYFVSKLEALGSAF